MKSIKVDLSRELKQIELVPFADLHIGDSLCDDKLIKEKIEYVKNNENVYCLLNGDILNNSTKTSVGDVYSEQLTPMEQLEKACSLFEPIKDKILCVTNGNHEARSLKSDGVDLMQMFCMKLKIEDKYARESGVLFLRFGAESRNHKETNGSGKARMITYVIYLTHGTGGGRNAGGKANALERMASIIDADIYIHSHTHLPMVMKQAFHRVDIRNSSISLVNKLFVNTSATLNYGGYGEVFEFKPNSKDIPHIFLCGTKKHFTAKL